MGGFRVGALVFAIAGLWFLQLLLSLYQSRRFHRAVLAMRTLGDKTSVGVAGSNWKRKQYAVLVVNEERMVVKGAVLSGFTVFANLKAHDGVAGLPLSRFAADRESLDGMDAKTWRAFQNAAAYIFKADGEQETSESAVELAEQAPAGGGYVR